MLQINLIYILCLLLDIVITITLVYAAIWLFGNTVIPVKYMPSDTCTKYIIQCQYHNIMCGIQTENHQHYNICHFTSYNFIFGLSTNKYASTFNTFMHLEHWDLFDKCISII